MNGDSGGAAPEWNQETAPSSTPGELLRAARQQRNLSIQQVADDLHLDVRSVQALEANDFAALGPPVYSRGYLRKYAPLVGLAPDLVISHYDLLSDVPPAPIPIPASVVAPPPERPSLKVPMRVVGGVVVAGLVLWFAGWLMNRPRSDEGATVQAPPSVVSEPPAEATPPVDLERETVAPAIASAERSASIPAVESPPAATGKDVTMRLRFSDASWVEIYDSAGRQLVYEIGQPGQERSLAGEPPLRVTLGLASAVSMEVNGRTVPVPRRAGKDAARFTVAADGSVR